MRVGMQFSVGVALWVLGWSQLFSGILLKSFPLITIGIVVNVTGVYLWTNSHYRYKVEGAR